MYLAGVDLGGTNTKIGVLNENGDIIRSTFIKTLSSEGPVKTLEKIWFAIKEILQEENIDEKNLIGIGLGVPGPVIDDSVVLSFANFPWDDNLNIAEIMEKVSGKKTKVANDVNVIAMGEAVYGAAKGSSISVTVAVGTGIGGGIYIDGKLLSGVSGAGGEVGHMKLVKDGKLCGCGQKGCFEAYASAIGLVREAISRLYVNKNNLLYEIIEGDFNKLEAKHIFDAAMEGDEFSLDLVEYEADHLAMGIGNIISIINPEVVVIGGGIALAGDFILDRIREKISKYAYSPGAKSVRITLGKLGNDAGIKGAAALLLEK
jgi:glucokinase